MHDESFWQPDRAFNVNAQSTKDSKIQNFNFNSHKVFFKTMKLLLLIFVRFLTVVLAEPVADDNVEADFKLQSVAGIIKRDESNSCSATDITSTNIDITITATITATASPSNNGTYALSRRSPLLLILVPLHLYRNVHSLATQSGKCLGYTKYTYTTVTVGGIIQSYECNCKCYWAKCYHKH